jgi:hypothetical protein
MASSCMERCCRCHAAAPPRRWRGGSRRPRLAALRPSLQQLGQGQAVVGHRVLQRLGVKPCNPTLAAGPDGHPHHAWRACASRVGGAPARQPLPTSTTNVDVNLRLFDRRKQRRLDPGCRRQPGGHDRYDHHHPGARTAGQQPVQASGLPRHAGRHSRGRRRVEKAGQVGRSLEDTVKAKPTAAYDAKWGNFVIGPAWFTRLVHEGV